MASCAVAVCKNSVKKNTNLVFHYFPKDKDLCKVWVDKCDRGEPFKVNCARICAEHFTPDDYIRDLQSELLQLNRKQRLKRNAVPSLNLLPSKEEPPEDRIKRELRKCVVENLLKMSLSKTCDKSTSTNDLKQPNPLLKEIEKLKKELNRSQENLRKSMLQLSIMRERIVTLKRSVSAAKRTVLESSGVKNKRQDDLQFKMRVHQVFGKVFTKGQLKSILSGGTRVTWSENDMVAALFLRGLSKQAYYHLRRNGYPLPSKTTLQRWKHNLNSADSIKGHSQPKDAEVSMSEKKEVDVQCEMLKKDGLID